MNIKRNIILTLEKRKKDGELVVENIPIRMRVIYGGKRVDFFTGYRIDFNKWDQSKQRVKNGCFNKLKQSATDINTDLNRYYNEIQTIFKDFELRNILPSPAQVKEAFHAKLTIYSCKSPKSENKNSFWEYLDEFTRDSGSKNNWTIATLAKFAAVKNHLTTFNPHLDFSYFTEDGLNEYVYFLRDKKKMRNSTILKQLGFLRWFLRWSYKKGYHQQNSCENYRPKLKNTSKKVIFLTWEELTKLRECEIPIPKQYLERVRDVFLFLCFTGLRHSDAYNLRRSDIKADHIEITTIKTADSLVIELNNHSRAILDKYKDIHFENDKALPVITNQKMNAYLKELAELAEINEPIRETYFRGNERIDEIYPKYALLGTHAGRRTFICNALSLGIPTQVVMKWTGHSDYKAMKPYIDIADNIKADAMSKFNLI